MIMNDIKRTYIKDETGTAYGELRNALFDTMESLNAVAIDLTNKLGEMKDGEERTYLMSLFKSICNVEIQGRDAFKRKEIVKKAELVKDGRKLYGICSHCGKPLFVLDEDNKFLRFCGNYCPFCGTRHDTEAIYKKAEELAKYKNKQTNKGY